LLVPLNREGVLKLRGRTGKPVVSKTDGHTFISITSGTAGRRRKKNELKIYRERRIQKKMTYRNPERKALVIQQAMSMNHIFMCGLSSCTIFFLIISYAVR
jgi:hypothetical protein